MKHYIIVEHYIVRGISLTKHVINYIYIEDYISGAPYSKVNYKYIYICFGAPYIYIANAISYIIHICTTLHIYIIFIEQDTHIDGVLIYRE